MKAMTPQMAAIRISEFPAIGAESFVSFRELSIGLEMPWARRTPERNVPDEDAELRDLMRQYALVRGHTNVDAESASEPANTTHKSFNPFKSVTSSSTPTTDMKTQSPADEVIQGQAISYTRAEAKLYENEEPCDSWRHFDVQLLQSKG